MSQTHFLVLSINVPDVNVGGSGQRNCYVEYIITSHMIARLVNTNYQNDLMSESCYSHHSTAKIHCIDKLQRDDSTECAFWYIQDNVHSCGRNGIAFNPKFNFVDDEVDYQVSGLQLTELNAHSTSSTIHFMVEAILIFSTPTNFQPSRIHQLHLCKRVRPLQWVSGYNAKQSDGKAPGMLELWRMRSTPSLPSLPGPLWSGVVAPERVLSIGQIELFDI